MPDAGGNLTPEETRLVQERLAALWQTHGPVLCPVTRDSDWMIQQAVVAPVAFSGSVGFNTSAMQYPCVAVMCRTCGFMMYFNAIWLGLFTEELARLAQAPRPAPPTMPPQGP